MSPVTVSRRSLVMGSVLSPLAGAALSSSPGPSASSAAPLRVVYPNVEERPASAYGYQLLELALKKSGVPYRLSIFDRPSSSQRAGAQLESGEIDVMDNGSSVKSAQRFDLVPFPLDLGLSGCRMLLGRNDRLKRLDAVKSLVDLVPFVFGQGQGWLDAKILRTAGLRVVEGEYGNLFRMLEAGRFDYYPLGSEEAYEVLTRNQALAPDVAVHPGLALFYPFIRVFYVTRGNEALHNALMAGLEAASADGSLQAFLAKTSGLGPILSGQRPLPRTLLAMPNPWWPPSLHGITLSRFHPALRPALRQLNFSD
ncbi:MAG TPA: hypothetical protein VGM81_14570 [Burkholderiaceae bacterium]